MKKRKKQRGIAHRFTVFMCASHQHHLNICHRKSKIAKCACTHSREEKKRNVCASLLEYFCRHVYCFHAIVHAFVALPHLSDECSLVFLSLCSLLRSAVFFIITDFIRLEFRAPLNLIVFECMCVDC